jgi:hypothetical protein
MPTRMWKHTCPQGGGTVRMSTPTCQSRGGAGDYDGWFYRMHEAMAAYQTAYGLKSLGPHRRLADELFDAVTVRCPACDARGIQDAGDGANWVFCELCRGLRVLFRGPVTELIEIRRRVLEAFPDAAADPVPGIAAAPLALDLARQQIINLEAVARPEAQQ